MSDRQVVMPDTTITEEMIESMRAKVGMKLRLDENTHNEYATRMAILKFTEGVGDPNPLWSDIEYARNGPYGSIVAPPSFIWACAAHVIFGWRGLGGFHAGCNAELLKPIYVGDKIIAECVFKDFEGPKESSFADQTIIDHFENKYWNQDGALLAKYHWWVVHFARAKARKNKKEEHIELPHPWTEEQLAQIEQQVLSEEIRGSKPRYWEDVEVGEDVGPVVKGPLGVTDEIAYAIGGAVPVPRFKAHGVALRSYRKHPAWMFRDPNTFACEPIFAVHYNRAAANAMGLPQSYDVGLQRHTWGVHLITNWMGDTGWLKGSYTKYTKFVYLSDVVWLKGKVADKYIDEEGDHCVRIERCAVNQRGENVMPGYAIVALPSRTAKTSPLDKRILQQTR